MAVSSRIIGDIEEVLRSPGELSLEWRINNSLFLLKTNFKACMSPQFTTFSDKWIMGIVVRNTKDKSGFLSFNVMQCKPARNKIVNIVVGLKGPKGIIKSEKLIGKLVRNGGNCWYSGHFCLLSELQNQSSKQDKGLTIICRMKLPGTDRTTKELKDCLQNLLKSEEDCDVVINVQGKEFRAHRLILRARSPVFQAMFTHDMVEKQKGIVTIEDCDPGTFPEFLEHIYTGNIEMISTGNVFSLFTASDKYDFSTLKKSCVEFIKENLTIASFCDAITLAAKYNEKELIEHATEFFCNNALDIVKTDEWQTFLKENSTVGNELLVKLLSK